MDLENGNGWGDSTVPNLSAKGVHEHVKIEIPFRAGKNESEKESFNHQKSYEHEGVRLSVLWSITNLVKGLQ